MLPLSGPYLVLQVLREVLRLLQGEPGHQLRGQDVAAAQLVDHLGHAFRGMRTFGQGIADAQHRHQVVDVAVDALSHAGVLGTRQRARFTRVNLADGRGGKRTLLKRLQLVSPVRTQVAVQRFLWGWKKKKKKKKKKRKKKKEEEEKKKKEEEEEKKEEEETKKKEEEEKK
ncbi:hypothetical protein EYF80_051175 [Liparis tanakae]|uniref:Uncharacterized protein n=1 Tax=Liparis tanakae TaxID=230148 RepID=A0A4Z2FBV8_9TELE|nr:hypothetical protein EYF80_051175 [Liparis tanakae]